MMKIIGVGGAGCNTIKRLTATSGVAAEILAIDSDSKSLARSRANRRLLLQGQDFHDTDARGLMAGLDEAHSVIVAAGLGGDTGGPISAIVVGAAREMKIPTVAIVNFPFSFEGTRRRQAADREIARLREVATFLIVFQNDRLLNVASKNQSTTEAFHLGHVAFEEVARALDGLVARRDIHEALARMSPELSQLADPLWIGNDGEYDDTSWAMEVMVPVEISAVLVADEQPSSRPVGPLLLPRPELPEEEREARALAALQAYDADARARTAKPEAETAPGEDGWMATVSELLAKAIAKASLIDDKAAFEAEARKMSLEDWRFGQKTKVAAIGGLTGLIAGIT